MVVQGLCCRTKLFTGFHLTQLLSLPVIDNSTVEGRRHVVCGDHEIKQKLSKLSLLFSEEIEGTITTLCHELLQLAMFVGGLFCFSMAYVC